MFVYKNSIFVLNNRKMQVFDFQISSRLKLIKRQTKIKLMIWCLILFFCFYLIFLGFVNPGEFLCSICKVKCNSEDTYKVHLDGKKHKQRLR